MKLNGIHHITAITADAQANVDFYTRVLGLRMVKKSVNQDDPTVYHLFYGDEHAKPGLDLTFFEYPGAPPGRAGDGMVHRIVWRVGGPAALDFWAERLAGEGIDTSATATRCASATPRGSSTSSARRRAGRAAHRRAPGGPGRARAAGLPRRARLRLRPERSRHLLTTARLQPHATRLGDARREPRRRVRLRRPARRARRPGRGHVHHVAWTSTDEEHQAWRGAGPTDGGHPTAVIDRHYFRSIYFREPSGVLFEIATRARASRSTSRSRRSARSSRSRRSSSRAAPTSRPPSSRSSTSARGRSSAARQMPPVELVFEGGTVRTLDPSARRRETLAVRAGRVAAAAGA